MPETNLFLMFTQRLNILGVAYMVSGSVAVIIYGQPRLTHARYGIELLKLCAILFFACSQIFCRVSRQVTTMLEPLPVRRCAYW